MAHVSEISRRAFLSGATRSREHYSAPLSSAETRIAEISDDCLARAGIFCMSCRDACSRQAIRFYPSIGGAFLPEMVASACTGCGACVAPCPGQAITLSDVPEEAVGA
jgi:ferredoxin-type protein NapF